ncbi:DUF6630 family protein [Saccharothrix obliqua]|uniref:DUF6630 family protein n=1 Tax=Saccharothrix obliqua TaxID=2861747 RepID=UPI001C5F9F62|nr:DUF6630 family protein [Saccharothrix obliqua]MBW4716362.1 hypothetical protein [Saccharothrix obliqua]
MPSKPPGEHMSNVRTALAALAELLAPDAPDVGKRVLSAHDEPAEFVRAHADQLDERRIDEPIPGLAWIALVDALTDHGLLAEVDWKEDPAEVVAQLKALRSAPAEWGWVGETDTHVPTYDFLRAAGRRLRALGTALVVLDIESDCYPLTLVPVDHVREVVDLAATAGHHAAPLDEG